MSLGTNTMSSLQDFWTAFVMISFLVFKAQAGQKPGKLQGPEQEKSVYSKENRIFI